MPSPSAPPPTPPPAPSLHIFRALGYRNFRLFFLGQGVSLVGTWMQQVAMSWLVYRLTNSPFLLGFVGFAGQLPMLLLAPVAGVFADRWDRHRIMLTTQSLSMLQAFTVTALVMTNRITIWWIIPLNAFIGCVNAFDMPARQSYFISMIGRREDLGNAIALNSSIVNGARLVGPMVAGVAIARWGEGFCFLLNGVSYWAVLASLWAMDPVPFVPGAQKGGVLEHMMEGLRYGLGFPPMRAILLLLALVSLVGVPYSTLMPVFARVQLGGGAHTFGWLLGLAGLGAFLGAITLAARRSVLGLGRIIVLSTALFGLALVILPFTHSLAFSAPFLVLAGFGMIMTLAAANTILQSMVEDRMRARIMSLYAMAFMGMVPFGSLLFGKLCDAFGVGDTLLTGGVLCLLGAAWFAVRLGGYRELARPIYVEKGILPGANEPLSQGEAGR